MRSYVIFWKLFCRALASKILKIIVLLSFFKYCFMRTSVKEFLISLYVGYVAKAVSIFIIDTFLGIVKNIRRYYIGSDLSTHITVFKKTQYKIIFKILEMIC